MVRDLGFGFGRFFHCKLKSFSKINRAIKGGGTRVPVFKECSKVNWSVCKDLMPEDWWEIRDVSLGLKTLDSLFDNGGVGVPEEVCLV